MSFLAHFASFSGFAGVFTTLALTAVVGALAVHGNAAQPQLKPIPVRVRRR